MIRSLVVAVLFCGLPASQGASIFDFESNAIGMATGFTDTSNGLSATFSSSGDPGGFVIAPSFFTTLQGNVLLGHSPNVNGFNLEIGFSTNVTSIALDFALDSPGPLVFVLRGYENGTIVGQTSASDSAPGPGLFPEGFASFNGAIFNNVTLSSPAPNFAVDNIVVTSTLTPEPGTLPLLAGSFLLAGGILYFRRRKKEAF